MTGAQTNGADADGEVVWSWRPTLASSFAKDASRPTGRDPSSIREATVANKPDHRGEREVSRKQLRREGRSVSAEPVCSCAFSYVHLAHETAGAARTRSSLRPLLKGRDEGFKNLGRFPSRDREVTSPPLFEI